MKNLISPLATLFFLGLSWAIQAQTEPIAQAKAISRIAFGSCNKHDLPQPLWPYIQKNAPDLWIWLGDNIYGDTHDMQVLQEKYEAQNQVQAYQNFASRIPIIGVWDDHDYGINDGGRNYAQKDSSQQLLLDFLGVPDDAPQRTRAGVYASYSYGPKGQKVMVILLDDRYHRDTVQKVNKRYISSSGSILGTKQWAWLEAQLDQSDADVHIIANGIQIIPMQHPYEKWMNFPKDRTRLLKLLSDKKIKNPILLSGDRHIGEISKIPGQTPVYEVTSSGLTHSWDTRKNEDEPNRFRMGELVNQLHFGLIQIDWANQEISLELKGKNQVSYIKETFPIK